jgi:site-specific DNA-methyltransferase (adenine-specific)
MTNTLNLENALKEARKAGFKLHNVLCWVKNNCTPNRWYMKNVEYTLFLRKGKAKAIRNKSSKTAHHFNNVSNKAHPTEKPIQLMELYISNSTNEGDTVLDPFMGSGTTLVAAAKLGRNAIGIELDEQYYRISVDRVKKECSENLFDKPIQICYDTDIIK